MMLLELLLRQPGSHNITNIFIRENVTFFKVDGESFCTAANQIYHHTHSMFDGPIIRVRAAEEHDLQVKKKMLVHEEQQQYEDRIWDTHEQDVVAALVIKSCEILAHQGPEEMLEFLYAHLTIIPDEQARLMAKKLEDDL